MNKKITLLIVSCLLIITSVYSNDDFFYQKDIFTVIKKQLKSKNLHNTPFDLNIMLSSNEALSDSTRGVNIFNSNAHQIPPTDTTDPVTIAQNVTTVLDANGVAIITTNQADNGSSDDSGNVTLSLSNENFNCTDVVTIADNLTTLGQTGANSSGGPNAQAFLPTVSGVLERVDLQFRNFDNFNKTGSIQIVKNNIDNTGFELVAEGTMELLPGVNTTTVTLNKNPYLLQNELYAIVVTNTGGNTNVRWRTGGTPLTRGWQFNTGSNPTIPLSAPDSNDIFFQTFIREITGTPATVSLTATDAAGNSSSEDLLVFVTDTEAPQLTLVGDQVVEIESGSTYNDAGVTESDNCNVNLVTTNPVDTSVLNSYTVTYNATDNAGNNATAITRTVNVVDTTPPVITLLGNTPVTLEFGDTYSDAGATASDNLDGNITNNVTAVSNVNTNAVGSYRVTYNVNDANSNSAIEVVRTVNVVDTTIPVITLIGANPQLVEVGATYSELTATASDNVDGDISNNIVIDATNVNPLLLGTYNVTYNVVDAATNLAVEVVRTVNVVDTTIPQITNPSLSLQENTTSIGQVLVTDNDPNATFTFAFQGANTDSDFFNLDPNTGVLSFKLAPDFENPQDIGADNTYNFNILVTDSNSNSSVTGAQVVVLNVDDTPPTITLTGDNPQIIEVGEVYSELQATASDNVDGDISGNILVDATNVNTSIVGSYTVFYNVQDGNSNSAATATRTVNVVDTTIPTITLIGANPQVIEVGSAYTELTATASDNYDGDISGDIVIDATNVDTAIVGTYTVTYNVIDANTNAALEVEGTVSVVDTTKPIITLTGNNPQVIEVHSPYTELTATANDNYDGDISANIIIDATNVNTAIVGTYIVTYNVIDANSNAALEVERTVSVVDTTKPIITLVGVNPQVIEYNELYSELGATATDNYDDNTALTGTIVIDATNVVEGVLGTYTVTYNVTDVNGNVADQVERIVNIVDTTKPILNLIGANPQIIEIINGDDAVYVELGATASDEYDVNVDDNDIVINTSALMLDTVGCYPVTYTVTDASGNTSVKTRIVFVLEQGKPWAKDNSFAVNQDSSNNIFNVLNNDSYGTDGANGAHPISLSGTYTDNGGKLDLVGTNVQYTPRAGFSGVDYFSYTITDENGDGSGDASTANVTITVSLNAKPVALDDAIIVAENSGATSINIIANDTFGADGSHPTEALTVSAASAEGGTTVVNSNTGEIEYTPAANFTGLDSFTYTIKDTDGDTSTATVLVTVTIVDVVTPVLRPTALQDAATVVQNSGATSINVLVNDSFGTKGAIDNGLSMTDGTYMGASDKGGIISVDNKGTLSTLDDEILYTPKTGFVGEDGFKYTITDISGDTSITTVIVTVTQIDTPTAVADAVTVLEDSGLISIDVLANDSFGSDGPAIAPSITLTSVSSAGSTIVVNSEKVDYTPAVGFSGSDTFSYTITDGTGDVSTAALVTITVSAAGTSNVPLAQDDAITITQDSGVNLINILDDNGSGADSFGSDGPNANHPISLSAFFTDNGGKLELDGNVVKYTPRIGFVGTDNFNYTLTDLNGDGDAATVTITVNPIPLVLTAVNDAVTVGQDSGATNIQVLSNDVLVAGTSITAFDATSANSGLISLNDNGTPTIATDDFLTYTPAAGYAGVDTFTYTISDGVTSEIGTVTVTVQSAVIIPGVLAAKADAFTVAQYSTNTELNVFADNGSGADNYGATGPKDGGLTLINGTLSGATEQGNITIDDKGTLSPLDDRIVYTPNANYAGVDHFYYMITALNGNTAIAQVTITVTPTALTTITAVDDVLTVDFNSTNNNIDIFANDSGVRNLNNSANINIDALVFGAFSNGGSISQVDGGTIGFNDDYFLYTPANGFSGTETVTYTITYNTAATTAATITFTVSPTTSVNGVPSAKDDAVSFIRNSTDNIINILNDNGSGVDSYGTDGANATHPISLSGTFTDIGSKIELDGNTVKYTPKTNFTGTDTFSYTITDANGDASSAIVTVNIAALKSASETASSIEEVMQVYPNPSKGEFNVSVFSKNGDQVSILLFDVTGKVVYKEQRELKIGKNIIDLNLRVKAGVMFLKVYSENNNYGTKKIVLK